jgi:hypothetical protein
MISIFASKAVEVDDLLEDANDFQKNKNFRKHSRSTIFRGLASRR